MPRRRHRGRRVTVVGLVVGALVTTAGLIYTDAVSLISDVLSAETRARHDQQIAEKLDQEKPAIVSSADYDNTVPYTWKIVLDRTLTPEEQARLESIHFEGETDDFGRKVFDFLRPLGARVLRYPTPAGFHPDEAFWSDSTTFYLNLFSERTSQLSIIGMKAINVDCHTPSGRTIVELAPQGEATYTGVLFDLTTEDPIPFITDDGADQGQPYFNRRRIDLGGGQSPAGLRVEAMVLNRSCEWEIEARYHDSADGGGNVILKDGARPFFAEALPRAPEQYWVLDVGWPFLIPCHERPTQRSCRPRLEASGAGR